MKTIINTVEVSRVNSKLTFLLPENMTAYKLKLWKKRNSKALNEFLSGSICGSNEFKDFIHTHSFKVVYKTAGVCVTLANGQSLLFEYNQ